MTSATDEKEIFDFLDSLPTDDASSSNADATASAAINKSSGSGATQQTLKSGTDADGKKTNDDIFEFLDELEGKNKESGKKNNTYTKSSGSNDNNNKNEAKLESSNETIKDDEKSEGAGKKSTPVAPPLRTDEPVNDPITSIASW